MVVNATVLWALCISVALLSGTVVSSGCFTDLGLAAATGPGCLWYPNPCRVQINSDSRQCGYRGVCLTPPGVGAVAACEQCVSRPAFDGKCAASNSAGANVVLTRQLLYQRIAVAPLVMLAPQRHRGRHPHALELRTASDSLPTRRNSAQRTARFVGFLGTALDVRFGLSALTIGITTVGDQTGERRGFWVAPLPIDGSPAVADKYYAMDDGFEADAAVELMWNENSATVYRTAVGGARVAPRSPWHRLWRSHLGPPDARVANTTYRPAVTSTVLPAFDNQLASAMGYSGRMPPATLMLSVGGSAGVSVPVVNYPHQVYVAGDAALQLHTPVVDPRGGTNVLAPAASYVLNTTGETPVTRVASELTEAAVVDVQVVATMGKLYLLADASWRVVPFVDGNGTQANDRAVAAFAAFFTAGMRIDTFRNEASVVYRPGGRTARFFGHNSHGQFGSGAATVGNLSYGEADVTVTGLGPAEVLQSVHLGEQHCVAVTSAGRVLFSGATSSTRAACFEDGERLADRTTFGSVNDTDVNGTLVIGNVSSAAVGRGFSIFTVNGSIVGCGGADLITPAAQPTQYRYVFPSLQSRTVAAVCAGVSFVCFHATDGFGSCWGAATPGSTQETICQGGGTQFTEARQIGQGIADFVAESLSCGSTHVVYTQVAETAGNTSWLGGTVLERLAANPTQARHVRSCGPNDRGQLGGSVPQVFSQARPHAKLAVPEVFATADNTPGLNSFATVAGGAGVTSQEAALLPMTYVTGAVGVGYNTVVFTEARRYTTPTQLQVAFRAALAQYPPTARYQFTDPFHPVGAVPQGRRYEYTLLRGLQLVHVSNQTGTDWAVPPAPDVLGRRYAAGVVSADGGETFFEPWSALDRSHAISVGGSVSHTEAIPVLFVQLADGSLFNVSALEPCPGGVGVCTATEVVWGAPGVAVPGRTSALARGWASLYVQLEVRTFAATSSDSDVSSRWAAFNASVAHQRAVGWVTCEVITSGDDCTALTWFEGLGAAQGPGSVANSRATPSVPLGGISPSVTSFGLGEAAAVTLKPLRLTSTSLLSTQATQGQSADTPGFGSTCVFMRVDKRWWYVMFLPDGTLHVCSVSHSTSYYDSQRKPEWTMPTPGRLIVEHLSPSYKPLASFNITRLAFDLSCSGGIRVTNESLTPAPLSEDAFLLFDNASLAELFAAEPAWFTAGAGVMAKLRDYRPNDAQGCDGGFVVSAPHPVSFTRLHFFVRVGRGVFGGDSAVVELLSPHFNPATGIRYRIELGERGVVVSDVTPGRSDLRRLAAPIVGFTCTPLPPRTVGYNAIAVEFDPAAGRTRILVNGDEACRGTLLTAAQARSISGVYFGVRNPTGPALSEMTFREFVFCDHNAGPGQIFSACSADGRRYDNQVETVTETLILTPSATPLPTPTQSWTDTASTSVSTTVSSSVSASGSATVPPTVTATHLLTASVSLSLQPTVSRTVTRTVSGTSSRIPFRRLLLDLNIGADLSSTLLRRSGIEARLVIIGDFWNPFRDWHGTAAGMLHVVSTVSQGDNPHGFNAKYRTDGFVRGVIDPTNASVLTLQIGPFAQYSSLRDEHLVLSVLPAALASGIPFDDTVEFFIAGDGVEVGGTLRAGELAGAVFGLAAVGLGAPPSLLTNVAMNTMLLNFKCFNTEVVPQSWLMNPTGVSIADDRDLGNCVMNIVLFLGVFGVHGAVVAALKIRSNRPGWLKPMARAYFPGLPLVLTVPLLPGIVIGAWRAGVNHASALMLIFSIVVSIAVLGPAWFMYSALYDDRNFCARFEPLSPDAVMERKRLFPCISWFLPAGAWFGTDRFNTFHLRYHFVFAEYTPRRKFFFCAVYLAVLFEGLVFSLLNDTVLVCSAQLFMSLVLRVVLIVCILLLRPSLTVAAQVYYTVISATQLVAVAMYFCYALQSMTNTMRSVTQLALTVSTWTMVPANLALCVVFAWVTSVDLRERLAAYHGLRGLLALSRGLPRTAPPPEASQATPEKSAPPMLSLPLLDDSLAHPEHSPTDDPKDAPPSEPPAEAHPTPDLSEEDGFVFHPTPPLPSFDTTERRMPPTERPLGAEVSVWEAIAREELYDRPTAAFVDAEEDLL